MSYVPPRQYPPAAYSGPGLGTQQAPPNKSRVWLIVLIILGCLMFFSILICGGVFYFARQMIVDSSQFKTLQSNDGLATIAVPNNWRLNVADNSDASLNAGNPFSECYVLVITDSKFDLPEYDLDAYANLISTEMARRLGAILPPQRSRTSVNGMPGRLCDFRAIEAGHDVTFLIECVEGKNHYHQIMTWTLTSKIAKNRPVLDKVRHSFAEK